MLKITRKNILLADIAYILLQTVVSYFAFGRGCENSLYLHIVIWIITVMGGAKFGI